MLTSAREHYRVQQRITARAVVEAKKAAKKSGPGAVAAVVAAYQLLAARTSAAAVPAMLAEQSVETPAVGTVAATALAGVTSAGFPLDAYFGAVQDVAGLGLAVATQVQDAGRNAEAVAMVARADIGYARMLNLPSCSRCIMLAGAWYRWNQGFERHPKCFPAGVAVSGPASEAATRRWYEGELVVLSTASGQNLPLTGNHPVLTTRGWIPAHLLQEGDQVVRSTRAEGATPLVVPDHDQVPTLIEDVWRAFSMNGLDRVPTSPEDFHGDGRHGEIDVVRADRSLSDGVQSAGFDPVTQRGFADRIMPSVSFTSQGGAQLLDLTDATHSSGAVGGGGLSLPLVLSHAAGANRPGFTGTPALYSGLGESLGDYAARDAVLAGEGVLAGSGEVGANDVLGGDVLDLARWDAPGDPFSVESSSRYASLGLDLLQRLAGQVELDRVVELRRVEWSGHVYSLTSSEGWHVANSLIVSNCDCRHIPAMEAGARGLTTNPYDAFGSLPTAAELAAKYPGLTVKERRKRGLLSQEDIFTKTGAQAIRDGADIIQVVNARRGMRKAQLYGREAFITTEGTTKSGIYGRSQGADLGYVAERIGRYGYIKNQTRRRAKRTRIMPETIYAVATDREDAQRLLTLYGYILP